MYRETIKKIDQAEAVSIQLNRYEPEEGMSEYQLLLSGTDPTLPFKQQAENLWEAYIRVMREELSDQKACPVMRRYFVSDAANQAGWLQAWESENGCSAYSIVQQPPMNGTKIALWCYLLTDVTVERAAEGLWQVAHAGYRHYWIGGLTARATDAEQQTRLLLGDYVMRLMRQRMTLSANCLRTWLFVQNVDVNYAGVVKARRELFVTQGLTEQTHYIASTGIEGRHADPEVCVQMDAYAVEGLRPKQIQQLYAPTHLNPTYEYGVTFERGTAIHYPDRTHILISGTASIDNQGTILYEGDVIRQAERMMENISALLAEAGATTDDITQAITYLRDPADYAVVSRYFATHYPHLPQLIVLAPVCRPGWLIETECWAVGCKI